MHSNSSIDRYEIEKFDKLSAKWWDTSGEFKMLHEINPLRLKFIGDKIKLHYNITGDDSFNNLNVLDVGCGGGLISVPLARANAKVTAIDASVNNIRIAEQYTHKLNLNIRYRNVTVEDMLIEHMKFDVIICLEVVEHVANVANFVKNVANLLQPGGMMILSTINKNLKSYLLAIIAAEYILRWVPKRTHNYSKFIKPSELSSLLAKSNSRFQELKGIEFDIFSRMWKLSNNIDVNYIAYIVF